MTSPPEEPTPTAPDPFRGPSWSPEPGDGTAAADPARHRRRRPSRRRLARRRRLGFALVTVGGLILLAGVYLVVTAVLARSQLESVRAEVGQLRAQISAGDLTAARATAREIADHAGSAHSYTAGPVWALAAELPAGGAPLQTVRTITAQVDVLGRQVLPQIITATRGLEPSTLRNSDGSFDLGRLQAISPALTSADRAMAGATARVAARPSTTWLSSVDSARTQLLAQMQSLGKIVQSADIAARVAPSMLGADGTKRYFVSFQNDAEARGTGGLPGAFGIVRADHGRVSIERFESDAVLNGVSGKVDFGSAYNQIWSRSLPYDEYVDSNVSPNFPYAAQIWMAMWQNKAHEKLDGALALDPTALSYLLAVTGPATLQDGSSITAANIVQLTQQELYARFPAATANAQRKNYLLEVARAASTKILASSGNTTALLKAAGQAAADRRLLVYSADAANEADLTRTTLAGALPVGTAPFAGLVVNNAAGNKLDYYLDRSLTWTRTGCGTTRQVTVTVRLTNTAPTGLPEYVTERNDHPRYRTELGDTRLFVSYYASAGAFRRTTTLDGVAAGISQGTEAGHPVYSLGVEMPRGATRTIVFTFTEPAGKGEPTVLRQPLVRPLSVTVSDQNCG